jgi:hypothetical protein
MTRIGYRVTALVLFLLASPVLGDDVIDCAPGSGMHFNGGEMICDERLPSVTPPRPPANCSPTTAPGTVCTWPARVLVISQDGTVEDMAWPNGKLVAIIESRPIMLFGAPLSSDFVRISQHINDCYGAPGKTPVCFWYDWTKP